MRTSVLMVAAAVLLVGGSAYANCFGTPDIEDDCDGDGCRRGYGDCNDSPDGGAKQHGVCATPSGTLPALAEVCDGIDNNCSGATDEGDPGGGGACTVPGGKGLCAPGVYHCQSAAVQCVGNVGPVTETCDGFDNDCDGLTDEQDSPNQAQKLVQTCFDGPGTPNVGICKSGQQACNAAADAGVASWTSCGGCGALATCASQVVGTNPPAQAEGLCNGKDDDCDGTVDDGNPGGGMSCSTGKSGVCAAGTLQCHGDAGVLCDQNVNSSNEVCDGRDNDCDGDTDEQGAPGSDKLVQSCYPFGSGTPGVGECKSGQQACNAPANNGSATWSTCGVCGGLASCLTPVGPTAEVCDNKDNDCDGTLNNGNPGGGGACTSTNVGICAPGTNTCRVVNDAGVIQCVSNVTPGTVAETCDGLDNDCDGDTDESGGVGSSKLTRSCYPTPASTYGTPGSGTNTCRNGTQACNAAAGSGSASYSTCGSCPGLASCVMPITAVGTPNQPELYCNGLNENCDSLGVDNGFNVGGTCVASGVGRCASGVIACAPDAGTQCNQNSPVAETCNNVDDNCNGSTDEGDPGGGGTCPVSGKQGPCAVGVRHCQGGSLVCPQITFPGMETCNGIDDDCNGTVDDGIPQVGMACSTAGLGECQPGHWVCNGTSLQCVANNTPQPESCDGKDNDCNGLVDDNVAARKCYTGPVGTYGGTCPGSSCTPFGDCRAGTQTCVSGGTGQWNACTGVTLPATEVCDGVHDEDCDGNIDNGLIIDKDGDGSRACGTCDAPAAPACDCNDNPDGGAAIKPGKLELCNGLDDNCNGNVDEGSGPTGKISRNCYSGPANTQGKGICVAGTQECNAVAGGSESYGQCVGQVTPVSSPDAGETLCNGKDDNCNGAVDDGFDNDNDGFVSCAMCSGFDGGLCDCNDGDFGIKPGAVEVCDTVDNNCNGRLDDVPPRKCFSDSNGMNEPPNTYTGTCPGPTCTPNGACVAGTQTCTTAGAWGGCASVVLPMAEACNGKDDDCNGTVDDANFDMDGDGFKSCALCMPLDGGACDCNDNDKNVHPGAPEVCDNVDNDCDGTTDGVATACYSGPANTRGKGLCHDGTQACSGGVGTGACAGEVTPALLPDGGVPQYADAGFNEPELLCDGKDEDCDGVVDDGFDLDGDGQTTCQGDCDDKDPFNKVGGAEICDCKDNNCNATIDDNNACYGAPCHDLDRDGFTNCEGDCNDTPGQGEAIGPTRSEKVGDGVDNDCDGAIDEDTDEDGDGWSTGQGDCDDHLRDINPGALEKCDGFDNNCNNQVDEGFDEDHDFVAVCAGDCDDHNADVSPIRNEVCGNGKDDNCDGRIDEETDVDGDGVSTCQGDCNDYNPAVHPAFGSVAAAAEVCDGQDNDCNFKIDEGFDVDGDHVSACFGDCDDKDPAVNPFQVEVPGNGKDDNCNGQVDEGMVDRDGDGFSPNCGDCNDSNPAVNPHAKEVCDRVDNNCDGYVDSAKGVYNLCAVCFDADGDGQTNCDGDCNDADKAVYRGAAEICDGKDNDCDGMLDLDPVTGLKVCREGDDGGVDAGRPDSGVADAGAGDAGSVVMEPGDAGTGTKDRSVISTGCGCNSSDGAAPLALVALGVLALRRRRRLVRRGSSVAAVVAGSVLWLGCPSTLEAPVDKADGGTLPVTDGGNVADAGFDAGFMPPVENWPCPGLVPVEHFEAPIPTTTVVFAHSRDYKVTTIDLANGVVLDDATHEIAALVIVRDLPIGADPLDPTTLDEIASRDIGGLDTLQGSPLVRDRIERFSKVYDDDRGSKNFSTSQDVSFATPTNAYAVRNRLLAYFSNKTPSSLGTLPVVDNARAEADMTLSLFFRVTQTQVFVGAAVTPASKFKENQSLMSDLANGSHLSGTNGRVAYACEHRTTPALKTDFIFVIDNTPSTVVWHAALQTASTSLFDAFERSGLDFRIGVVTTDSEVLRGKGFTKNIDDFKEAAQVGLGGNITEMGIEYGLRAILRAKAQTDDAHKLRDDAGLVVLFMSDEDNNNIVPISTYVQDYKDQHAIAFSIVGPLPAGCTKVGYAQASAAGKNYITLANQTGGSSGSICNENVSEVIEEIVIGALGASSRSALMKRPISASLAVRTDAVASVARSRSNGFDYEPGNNSILFFGQAAPKVGANYDAAYAFFQYIQ